MVKVSELYPIIFHEASTVHADLRCRQMADFDLSASFIPSLHKPSSLLPIARHRQSLLYLVETFPVTIIVGQTGSYGPGSKV